MRLYIDLSKAAAAAVPQVQASAAPAAPKPAAPAAPKPAAPAAPAAPKPAAPAGGAQKPKATGAAPKLGIGAAVGQTIGTVQSMTRSTNKGLEQVRAPRDINEWEAGKPHEGPAQSVIDGKPQEKPVSKGTQTATALLMFDSMIKAAQEKGVRLVPDAGVNKGGEEEEKKDQPKAADKPPGPSAQATPLTQVTKPISQPGSGSHLNFSMGKACGDVKKDFEHMAGEYKKMAPASPSATKQATAMFGPSASQQGAGEKKQAIAGAAGGPSSDTKQALASIKPPGQATGGASGAVKDAPAGVFTSAPSQPKMAPTTPSLKPGSTISMTSVAGPQAKKVAGMSKSQEALEILKGMIEKAHQSPGNAANENWSTGAPQSPGNAAVESHGTGGTEFGGNKSQMNGPVSGAAHGGKGPASTTCSNTDEESHGGRGSSQNSVSGYEFAGNESQMNKAMGAGSVPRMPRGMAMAMDSWRSATDVMTRGNSRFAKHAGTGPLNAEVLEQVENDTEARTTQYQRSGILKACGGCGRTYTLRKSDDTCPTCSTRHLGIMAKSRGGMLISTGL